MDSNSIKLQATALTQLTQATNQLTRTTAVKIIPFVLLFKRYFCIFKQLLASNKCHQLAGALYAMASRISSDDVQTAAIQITECMNNAMTVSVFF